MDEGPNIYRVAEDMVRRFGTGAYSYLCEQAEIAKLSGDRESAITWWDIALAVIEIQNLRAAGVMASFFGLLLV
jgi:hypothetical protein